MRLILAIRADGGVVDRHMVEPAGHREVIRQVEVAAVGNEHAALFFRSGNVIQGVHRVCKNQDGLSEPTILEKDDTSAANRASPAELGYLPEESSPFICQTPM